MLISVIIVCHPKYHHMLRLALQSLNHQSLKNFQIILVLNGYKEIPELRADNDLTIIRTPETTLATACNTGVNVSKGKYVIRLDADDTFHKDILEFESALLNNSNSFDAVWCNFNRFEEGCLPQLMDHEVLEHACGVMFRRTVFDTLSGYDESLQFQESFDFWLRFKQHGFKDVKLNQPLYNYRKHHGSMSTNTANRNQARINILMRSE